MSIYNNRLIISIQTTMHIASATQNKLITDSFFGDFS
jgi:hypothetical protein